MEDTRGPYVIRERAWIDSAAPEQSIAHAMTEHGTAETVHGRTSAGIGRGHRRRFRAVFTNPTIDSERFRKRPVYLVVGTKLYSLPVHRARREVISCRLSALLGTTSQCAPSMCTGKQPRVFFERPLSGRSTKEARYLSFVLAESRSHRRSRGDEQTRQFKSAISVYLVLTRVAHNRDERRSARGERAFQYI